MSKVEKLSIALTGELAEQVRVAVRTGDYASSSEVIREALRDWTDKRERRAAKLFELRRLVQEGLDSGEPVEREPLDVFLARNRKALAERQNG
ncbi:type II toxin-antitoxin system ParD family antitoxin [Phenylobacterium sp.]|uniref:type II toxin-antitoxin system ParD family antitoxin n=1 Tax=Phenylobacterium sp. TaxID=1871053 RepID=UPI003BAB8A51